MRIDVLTLNMITSLSIKCIFLGLKNGISDVFLKHKHAFMRWYDDLNVG